MLQDTTVISGWTSLGGGWSWLTIRAKGNHPVSVILSNSTPTSESIGIEFPTGQLIEIRNVSEQVWVKSLDTVTISVQWVGEKFHVG